MTNEAIQSLCKAIALLAVGVGAVGSLLCFPYALSYDLFTIATAGIYFVAGAVLISVGLLSYVILHKTTTTA